MATTARTGAAAGIPEYTIPTIRRISYVLPNVDRPPCLFALPQAAQIAKGSTYQRSGPLLIPHADQSSAIGDRRRHNRPRKQHSTGSPSISSNTPLGSSAHPRHSLPVSSLAIDATTQLQGAGSTPRGILYAGGRDGMISAWDLGLPMQRRRRSSRVCMSGLGEYDDEATAGLLDDYAMEDRETPGYPLSPDGDQYAAFTSEWEVIPHAAHDEPIGEASFRQCIGSHTDWINDVLLCNGNQTVVSASSDGNVNIWNPHDPQSSLTPQVLGTHKDYVRALTHAPQANWVASGSFDKTIKLWDLGELRHDPIMTIPEANVRSSVYTISTNPRGTVVAGGSPERVVRVWDPRSGQQVSQLIGHSDTVRKVIMSEDAAYLLSASADSTVKLWSLAEQRCLHTFTHHTDSVWALQSDHPRLDIFYSGDRSGLLCKVDWERCNEVSEGECVVLAKETAFDGNAKFRTEACASGIHSIASLDNTYLWTANASGAISRWQDVPSRAAREALYPIIAPAPHGRRIASGEPAPASNPRINALRGTSSQGHGASGVSFAEHLGITSSPKSGTLGSPTELNRPERDGRADGLFGVPFDSLVCLAPPNDPYGAAIGLGSVSMRVASRGATPGETETIFSSASLVSIPSALRHNSFGPMGEMDRGSPSLQLQLQQQSGLAASPHGPPFASQFRNLGPRPSSVRSGSLRFAPTDTHHEYEAYGADPTLEHDDVEEQGDDVALEARLAFEERELAIDAKPLRSEPEDVIRTSHGLIRSTLLNDRRHCLTIDAVGSICLWDILAGKCLGAFRWEETVEAARSSGLSRDLLPGEVLDVVKERIQGFGAAPIWCTVDTKIGSLSVHLEYPRCFDAEIYLDECEESFRPADPQFTYKEDQRVNVGRMVLKSLFAGFVRREMQLRTGKSPPLLGGSLAFEKKDVLERLNQSSFDGQQHSVSHRVVGGASGMRIALAIAPKTPATLPVHSPLSPTNTHLLSDLQRFVISQKPSTENEASGGPGDYFSIQRGTDQVNSNASTPHGKGEPPMTPSAISPTSPGGGGLMGRLRMGLRRDGTQSKKAPKTPGVATPSMPTKGDSRTSLAGSADDREAALAGDETRQQLQALRSVLATAGAHSNAADLTAQDDKQQQQQQQQQSRHMAEEVPAIAFMPQTALIISESAHDSGAFKVSYRGLVGSTQDDIVSLELQSPLWLLEQLLDAGEGAAVMQNREKDKLTFLLLPWEPQGGEQSNGSANGKASSPLSTNETGATEVDKHYKMPSMPSGNSRLTATRMLRIKKACAYVADKLRLIDQDYPSNTGADSGFSSIVTSRRGSTVIPDQTAAATGGAASANGQMGGANGGALARALSMTNAAQQQQQSLQLRRPSATSIRTSSAAAEPLPALVMPSSAAAHDYIEVLCKDVIVPPLMTLAQIHRYIWKSGSPIKLEYRWTKGIERET